jgi:hypothetical protein
LCINKCIMAAPKKITKSGDHQAKKPGMMMSGVSSSVGKATQFKPGVSGNPAGKPKGAKHINTWIQELAEDEEFTALLVDLKDGFKEFKGAPIKAIIKQAINEAVGSQDPKVRQSAREWIAKYGWASKNEVTGADGAPLMPVALDSSILNRLTSSAPAPSIPKQNSGQ